MIDRFDGEDFFLSNFYPGDKTSLEHAFQSAKTHNPLEKKEIMAKTTPGKAKRAGRKATLREDWEDMKVLIMWLLMERKFSNPVLQGLLLATDDEELIEGNRHHDNFWGNCVCSRIVCVNTPGKNMSGKLLMGLRKRIKTGKSQAKSIFKHVNLEMDRDILMEREI